MVPSWLRSAPLSLGPWLRGLRRSGSAGVGGALQELRAIGARRDRGELRRSGRAQAGILPRDVLDDVEFRLPLLHHPACRLSVLHSA
jgi:hypothetical protein